MSEVSPRARLAAFAAALVVVFGVGFGVGALGAQEDGGPTVSVTTTTMGAGHGDHG